MIARDPFTAALLDGLGELGFPVGDGEPPKGPLDLPYLILYPIPGGSVSGPAWADASRDATFVYQVTSVGDSREQCEKLADRVRPRMLAGGFTMPGAVVGSSWLDSSGGVDQEGALFSAADRFAFALTVS